MDTMGTREGAHLLIRRITANLTKVVEDRIKREDRMEDTNKVHLEEDPKVVNNKI